jgi:hypothetical protein
VSAPTRYAVIVWVDGAWQASVQTDAYGEATAARDSCPHPAVLVSTYGKFGDPCDTAIMHGPGHQSVTECHLRGEHSEHASADGRFEWTTDELTAQTYTRRRDGRVFRLASTGAEW